MWTPRILNQNIPVKPFSITYMKYFIDVKFIDGHVKPLFRRKRYFMDIVTVGIVCEDGRELYLICNEFDPEFANEVVKNFLLKPLINDCINNAHVDTRKNIEKFIKPNNLSFNTRVVQYLCGKSKKEIAKQIYDFLTYRHISKQVEGSDRIEVVDGNNNILEVWGYYCYYDWTIISSLFGIILDRPKELPLRCNDLSQLMHQHGLTPEWETSVLHMPSSSHSLQIARSNKQLYDIIQANIKK